VPYSRIVAVRRGRRKYHRRRVVVRGVLLAEPPSVPYRARAGRELSFDQRADQGDSDGGEQA
jgi:hypothetical protein